jgi:hypothetical protein
LLAKLRDLGLDIDRDGVERLCAGARSAEEVAKPIMDKREEVQEMLRFPAGPLMRRRTAGAWV